MTREADARAVRAARKAAGFSRKMLTQVSRVRSTIIAMIENELLDLTPRNKSMILRGLEVPRKHREFVFQVLGIDPETASVIQKCQLTLAECALTIRWRIKTRKTED